MDKFSLRFTIAFLLCYHHNLFKGNVADALPQQTYKISKIETKLPVWKLVRNLIQDFHGKVENFTVDNMDRNSITYGLSRESRLHSITESLLRNDTAVDYPYIPNRWSTGGEMEIFYQYRIRNRHVQELRFVEDDDDSRSNSSFPGALNRIWFLLFLRKFNDDIIGRETIFLREKQSAMGKDDISGLPRSTSDNAIVDHKFASSRVMAMIFMVHPVIRDGTTTQKVCGCKGKGASRSNLTRFEGERSSISAMLREEFFKSLDEDIRTMNESLPPGPLLELMRPWLDQSGIPLVKLDAVNQTHIRFSQSTFISEAHDDSAHRQLWNIPVTYITEEMPDQVQVFWLTQRSLILEHDVTKWIYVNPKATGYYRTLYSDHFLQQLSRELDKSSSETRISGMSQSQLMDDYMVFAREKYVSHATMLEMTTRILAQTEHLAVWKRMLLYNDQVFQRFRSHPEYQVVQEYVQYVIANSRALPNVLTQVKANPSLALSNLLTEEKADPSLDIPPSSFVLSNDIRELSCAVGGVQCQLLVSFPFPKSVPLREDKFLCEKADREFNYAFEEYIELRHMNMTEEHEKAGHKILRDLGCATRIGNIQNLLNKSIHPEELLYQPGELAYSKTFIGIYNSLASNPVASAELLPFLTSHFNETRNILGDWHKESIGSVLKTLSNNFCTRSQLNQMELFLERVGMADLDALNKVRENISWMDTHGNDILAFISKKQPWNRME